MYTASHIKPVSDLKAKAAQQDVASYEETQQTLALLKLLALGNEELAAGHARPLADVMTDLRSSG